MKIYFLLFWSVKRGQGHWWAILYWRRNVFHTQPSRWPLSVTVKCRQTMDFTGAFFPSWSIITDHLRSINLNCKLFSHCFPLLTFSLWVHIYHFQQVKRIKEEKTIRKVFRLAGENLLLMSALMSAWTLSQLDSLLSLLRTFGRLFGTVWGSPVTQPVHCLYVSILKWWSEGETRF